MGGVEFGDSESGIAGPPASADELQLVEALRRGDEAAFMLFVERYQTMMMRIALMYVSNRAVAEDVVQETWVGFLQGLARFEGRSSLKTWLFRILSNRARTRGSREGRSIPFSALAVDDDPHEPSVEPARFDEFTGHWTSSPGNWNEIPENRFLSMETRAYIQAAINTLPPSQQEVITLRDIEGWTSDEVCNVLGVTETNQRVLLHRARSKVRHTLDQYLNEK
jgi:RNA polymerase sigma-70 factor (ECF subfamily)